jgi:hypothetical protein
MPREKPMLGLHDALCVFVEDLGTHITKSQFGDKAQHKIVIMFELDEKMKEGKYAGFPFMVSKQYTFTLFEKGNLSKDLQSWFSKKLSDETRKNGFDLKTLIGRKCQLNLIESEDGRYINIGNILPASKDNAMVQVCVVCPEWVAKKRMASLEAQKHPGEDHGEPLPVNTYDGADDCEGLPF